VITDKTITQAVTKVACLSQRFQLSNETIDRLSWKHVLIKTVSLLDLIDFSDVVFLHFSHYHSPIIRILALGVAKCFDNFQSFIADRVQADIESFLGLA